MFRRNLNITEHLLSMKNSTKLPQYCSRSRRKAKAARTRRNENTWMMRLQAFNERQKQLGAFA